MLFLICKLGGVKHHYYLTIILTDQIPKEKVTRIGYREKKGEESVADEDFCFKISPQVTPSKYSLWKRAPQAERDPRCHQLTSQAASAVPCSLMGEQPLLPPTPAFTDADLITDFSLRCEQLSFCLRLIDIKLKLFKENS